MKKLFSSKSDVPRRRQSSTVERVSLQKNNTSSSAFRRNQTLTGSSSKYLQSTSEQHAHIQSPRAHAQLLTKKRRHISAIFILFASGAMVLSFLIYQFSAQITISTSSDIARSLDDTYEESTIDYLSSQPIQRFRFALDKKHLVTYLQARHPEVKDITDIRNGGFGVTQFSITMREPLVSWTFNNTQKYVDEHGVTFTQNYFSSPKIRITDNSGISTQGGKALASNRFLGFVGRVVSLSQDRQLEVRDVIIPAGTTREIDITFNRVSYPVKLSVDRAAGEQVEDMVRAIDWFEETGEKPEYIDVRVSGRAYYR